MGINAKKCMYERVIIVPTALYVAETWGMRIADRVNESECSLDEVLEKFGRSVTKGNIWK